MHSLITSPSQLTWINGEDAKIQGSDLTARIDDANLLAIYVDVIAVGDAQVTLVRILDDDTYFSSEYPGDWTDIEAALPRELWPAQVWAGSKWARKLRPTYPAIDAVVAAKLAAYEAACENNCE